MTPSSSATAPRASISLLSVNLNINMEQNIFATFTKVACIMDMDKVLFIEKAVNPWPKKKIGPKWIFKKAPKS